MRIEKGVTQGAARRFDFCRMVSKVRRFASVSALAGEGWVCSSIRYLLIASTTRLLKSDLYMHRNRPILKWQKLDGRGLLLVNTDRGRDLNIVQQQGVNAGQDMQGITVGRPKWILHMTTHTNHDNLL